MRSFIARTKSHKNNRRSLPCLSSLVTEILVDASAALRGAQEFETAATRIQLASERATASVDKLGLAVDRAGERLQQSAQRGGAHETGLGKQSEAAGGASEALAKLSAAHDKLTRDIQAGSIRLNNSLPAMERIAQARRGIENAGAAAPSFESRAAALLSTAGGVGVAPSASSLLSAIEGSRAPAAQVAAPLARTLGTDLAAGTAVSAPAVAPLVAASLESMNTGNYYGVQRLVRTATQVQSTNSTVQQNLAKSHASEAAVAASIAPSAVPALLPRQIKI